MELPWFGAQQPGDTYYYTTLIISNLIVVDCFNDHLNAHIYHKGEAKKGGNNVASLIMKTMINMGWIIDEKTCNYNIGQQELNIIFDNCTRQNKNNMVLILVPYLVDMGLFSKVNFIFLVVGHTKTQQIGYSIKWNISTGIFKYFV